MFEIYSDAEKLNELVLEFFSTLLTNFYKMIGKEPVGASGNFVKKDSLNFLLRANFGPLSTRIYPR